MGDGWTTASAIEKIAVPGDAIEINLGNGVSHFIFNIRKGWCVHVTPLESNEGDDPEVIKDATDLHQEAGSCPCRINNFEDLALEKDLIPRSLKSSLQMSRAGLAHGPIRQLVSDIPLVCQNGNIAQEFCVYWKYEVKRKAGHSNVALFYFLFMIVVAACAAGMLAFI